MNFTGHCTSGCSPFSGFSNMIYMMPQFYMTHLTCRSKQHLSDISEENMKTYSKNKTLFCLLFLLTSSSLRLMRFAIAAGNTVKSLSGMLSRWSNWQLNSCWWRQREDITQTLINSHVKKCMVNLPYTV